MMNNGCLRAVLNTIDQMQRIAFEWKSEAEFFKTFFEVFDLRVKLSY